MLVSVDWVRDFVKVPDLSPDEIYKKFTLSTAEVEEVKIKNAHLEKIQVVEILSFEKHPEADKLNLVTFKLSDTDIRKVICGASNVKVGLKVPFAPIGVKLPNGLLLEPKKIRGVLSEGMLCSEEELGFAESSEGILELDPKTPIGLTMLELYKLKKDTILDIDNKSLTHRPDLWGHYGMAREFATVYSLPLANPFTNDWMNNFKAKLQGTSPIKVRFNGDSAGITYFGLSIDQITVTETPLWMKERLLAAGLRSINSIVDISNYVMLELGMPLHIFDRQKIAGNEVVIEALQAETKFVTLDEVERSLLPGDTVIRDNNGPLVLAGIMGGLNSGVDESTKNIFIEVANWKAAMVRKTSTRLGLRTDSSQRYEKTLDSALCERTLWRTVELILQLNPEAKLVGQLEYAGIDLKTVNRAQMSTSAKRINQVLGHEVSEEKIISILTSLGFEIEKKGEELKVIAPTYRSTKDVDTEADLVEEIGRMIGFDNIVPNSPLQPVLPAKLTDFQKVVRKVRDFMVYQGQSFEIMTYPMIGDDLLKLTSWPKQSGLKIINSLSTDHDQMRDSLIPSHLEASALNAKNFDQFRFFEIGRTYHADEKDFSTEGARLGITFFDKKETPFLALTNLVNNLLTSLNISFELVKENPKFPNPFLPTEWIGNHPFEVHHLRVMGKLQGVIFSVHPIVLRNLKIKGNLSMCVFDLSIFEKQSFKDKTKYKPLLKFPSSSFDWSVVAEKNTAVETIVSVAKKVKLKELQNVQIVDVYPMGEEKSVTLRATLVDENSTLSGDFLKGAEQMLVDATAKAGFPLKK